MNEQNILNRSLLKEIVLEQKQELMLMPRGAPRDKLKELKDYYKNSQIIIIQGVRRCGKSTLLAQFLDTLPQPHFHYLNFEDERLVSFNISLFNQLLEVFYEVNGKHTLFVFDEIQVVEGWERFVRRLHNGGNKIFITGSNANLLSQELGTKLTGRHLDIELFPFSYMEFLRFQNYQHVENELNLTEKRSELHKYFTEYLTEGGMPIYLQNRQRNILSSLYDDIIIRDVLQRYRIDNIKLFRELTLYLTSNCTSSITYNKLKAYFHLGSVNTAIKYLGYLENCYFLFCINPFSPSFKKQINAPKKIYIICNAFIDKIGFHLTDNRGVLLENTVFLELRRRFENIFYYKTENNLEVDFLVYNHPKQAQLIQVTWSLSDARTKNRELNALTKAMEETKIKEAWILTEAEADTIVLENKTIHVIPVYQWLQE
ncbi:MAG: ATP-binding protein [Gammaproteobacteria bacterium]